IPLSTSTFISRDTPCSFPHDALPIFGGIIEEVAAGLDPLHVPVPGLRVHRDHQVDAAAGAAPALLRHPHLVPGGQALDVGGEDRSEEHTSELQSRENLVCRLLLVKTK